MNEHLKEPLHNYMNQDDPGYALLITGEWGVGKTHTLLNLLSKDNVYYVSLYGLSSEVDIHNNVFNAMYPLKNKLQLITDKFKGLDISAFGLRMGVGNVLSEMVGSSFKEDIKKDKVIIFDDLERCQICLNKTLGAINKYIEHYGCRVIVICNDNHSKNELLVSKEKLFGLTLKVLPNIEEAYVHFTKHFTKNKIHNEFNKKFSKLILDIFRTSNVQSLRILKHTINDCLQLYSVLEEKHKNNQNCMRELFSLFIASTFEARNGNLIKDDLINRTEKINDFIFKKNKNEILSYTHNDDDTPKKENKETTPKIKIISDKYVSIPFQSKIISDDDLNDAIFNGNFNKTSICNSINSTSYFLDSRNVPNWVIIYSFYNVDNETLDNAIKGLKDEFTNRKVIISGEMLHLFHLMFMMSYFKEISETYEEIESQCKKYIDDLYSEGKIEPTEINRTFHFRKNRSYGGYGFWTQDDYKDNSERIISHLSEARRKSFIDKQPVIQENIIDTLKHDIRKFAKLVGYDDGQPGEYFNTPILSGIPIQKFIEAWLSNSKNQWMTVTHSLQIRYEDGRLEEELSDEKEWIKSLLQELEQLSLQETGFRRHCLEMLAPPELKEYAFG
ncbi:P-loop NTPase fold protein [Buttiauxella noackiae]|uniref:P-loop NTPase fold protein n=1 Tax=Buttiauxella noackiae TaxID=82992 RepID=UPI002355EF95|nr:P-loop NTPase fold protein [Buttiauxella noackiae]MCA1923343.1 KAP family NTPase [Buttiauxella noackiae]